MAWDVTDLENMNGLKNKKRFITITFANKKSLGYKNSQGS
jgi:hypothetical protein